ncbi:hypothetical protein ALNOE001_19390 [Candidatus Methanobinarius endosymbioticus]|uniref:Right handed beta helix domain-containing protein n=1 Tax=Candidatus Methanobinarius endosymbioticus TaxID=2006182 RepID=A0A366MA95_9EURY|nr:hypothetical protein ALNOE001_19390 [Candidatus Methanobinarius endosymbioticus]
MNCKFINNTAWEGGAIYNSETNHYIANSTFMNNIVRSNGGAIYNLNPAYNLTITNSNFTNNHANGNGGAINNYNNVHNLSIINSGFYK